MEATRTRIGATLEWLIAAALMAALLFAGAFAARELRTVRAATPVIAKEAPVPEPPAGVPPRSVSVPMLLLGDGKQVRIGDRLADVAGRIGQAAQVGSDLVERVAGRERVTRVYNYIGSRFALVFESAARDEQRVTAIYVL